MDKQQIFDNVMNDIKSKKKTKWEHILQLRELGIPAMKVYSYTYTDDDFIAEVCIIWRNMKK